MIANGRILKQMVSLYILRRASSMASICMLVSYITVISTIIIVAISLIYHLDLMMFPLQWEYREGASLVQVIAWLSGRNIYSVEELPQLLNVYGILHIIFYSWIADWFGPTITHLRVATGALIIASTAVCFIHIRRLSGDVVLAIILSAGLYIQWLHYVIPLVRPDALGIFIFVSAISVSCRSKPTILWAFAILIFSLVGFFTKSFFVLIAPVVFSYWIIFLDFRKGTLLAITHGSIAVIVLILVNYFVPTYLSSVVLSQFSFAEQGYSSKSWAYLWSQIIVYVEITYALWFFVFAMALKAFLQKKSTNFIGIHLYTLILMSLFLIFKFGQVDGAYLTYFFELASAPLAFTVAQYWPLVRSRLATSSTIKLIFLIMTVYSMHIIFISNDDRTIWKNQLRTAAAATDGFEIVWASPLLASYLAETGRIVFDTGQNEYLSSELLSAGNPMGLGISVSRIRVAVSDFRCTRKKALANSTYDLIITDRSTEGRWFDRKSLEKNYTQNGSHNVGSWNLTYWTPRLRTP